MTKNKIIFVFAIVLTTGVCIFYKLHILSNKTLTVYEKNVSTSSSVKTIKKIAILLVNFNTAANDRQMSVADMSKLAFSAPDSLAAYWKEVSNGKWAIMGKVFDGITVRQASSSCTLDSNNKWGDEALAVAKKQGIDLSQYDYLVFAAKLPPLCPSMSSPIGEKGNRSFINIDRDLPAKYNKQSFFHEMGHMLGNLQHAGTMKCPLGIKNQQYELVNCEGDEYGDFYDAMGGQSRFNNKEWFYRQFNAYHKAELGFITAEHIKKVTQDGEYDLVSSEKEESGIQLIQIPLKNMHLQARPPAGSYFLYLDQRSNYGVFDKFEIDDPVVKGVSVYLGHTYQPKTPDEIRNSPIYRLILDDNSMSLAPGKSYTDPTQQVTLTTVSDKNGKARVKIQFSY